MIFAKKVGIVFWVECKSIPIIFVLRTTQKISNAVILTVSVSAGGTILSSITRNTSSSFHCAAKSRASGAIVEEKVTIGDYQVSSHIVDVFDASWASLPSSINGIIGLGEESCNPTCLHPFYHSILEKEIEDCALFLFSYLRSDDEEKMQLSVCFGSSKGLLTLGSTAESLRVK